jgi:hypothetical protein
MWQLRVDYDFVYGGSGRNKWNQLDTVAAVLIGKPPIKDDAGLGWRSLIFEFTIKSQAEAARRRLKLDGRFKIGSLTRRETKEA